MGCQKRVLQILAVKLLTVIMVGACAAPMPVGDAGGVLYARVTTPANPIRLEAQRDTPVIGLVFYGTRLPITGRMSNCEWLKVEMPPTLRHLGAEGWIIGPPEFALLDGGGCADIPDLTPIPTPAG